MTSNKAYILLGIFIGFCLFAFSFLLFVNYSPSASAQVSSSNNQMLGVTSHREGDDDLLFLVDSQSKRLAVYDYGASRGIRLLSIRNISYDLQLEDWNNSKMSYKVPVSKVQEFLKDK